MNFEEFLSPYEIQTLGFEMILEKYFRSPKRRRHLKELLIGFSIFFVREMNKEEPDFMIDKMLSSIVLVPCVTKEWMMDLLVNDIIQSEEDYIKFFSRKEGYSTNRYKEFQEMLNEKLNKVLKVEV